MGMGRAIARLTSHRAALPNMLMGRRVSVLVLQVLCPDTRIRVRKADDRDSWRSALYKGWV